MDKHAQAQEINANDNNNNNYHYYYYYFTITRLLKSRNLDGDSYSIHMFFPLSHWPK